MQAVIKTGGKQFRVKEGDIINVEKIKGNPGDYVEFNQVLMVSDAEKGNKLGSPLVADSTVKGEILRHLKGEKITVFKFKRKKGYRRKKGHRQIYTSIRITEVKG
ncbi:MAG: 50S ribosomal protein L21 [Candidatus Dadabacteria bacterium]|nr:50S ribosomal protein L21 [Candidatus Dadabacteria bacterium]